MSGIVSILDPGGTYLGGPGAGTEDRLNPGGYATGTSSSSGGKKGSGSAPSYAPPPSQPAPPEFDMEGMMTLMSALMMMSQNSNRPPAPIPPPTITPTERTDWTKHQQELQAKVTGQLTSKLQSKRGRSSTVLTDPLSTDPVHTTQSILTGT